jgi:predicted RecB family endonuclease
MSESKEIFKGKSVEDLYKEIYSNSKSTKSKVNDLIKVMTDKVENTADAIRIMPLIKDYLDVGVKNDEHLIKLAQIIQRSESKNNASDQDIYGDLQSLLDNVNQSPELPAPNQ